MTELSLNILDIAQNSVKAKASRIEITVDEYTALDRFTIVITDNGCGMSEEMQKTVLDPFTTTRKTRKIGLGLPLFKQAAEQTGGHLELKSKEGEGTAVTAVFSHSSIDRMPLGDIAGTITTLIQGSPEIEYVFCYIYNGRRFTLSTVEIRKTLGSVPIDSPEVLLWLSEYINENIAAMQGGGES
ncbi:MAG: ATP-binding protein [Bacillota bacterium]|nr:ATP-binding protein [Bacillota bacterium]